MVVSGRYQWVLALAAIGATFFAGYNFSRWSALNVGAVISGNGKAVDGDSVLVGAGKSVVDVRLYGIDAPEHDQDCKTLSGETWKCGRAATAELAKKVDDRPLRCEVVELERTGVRRPIAKCFDGERSIGDEMMRMGLAWAFRRYLESRPEELAHFTALEAAAKSNSLGIWRGDSQEPWEFRAQRWERYKTRAPRGCPIIGNKHGKQGKKIYHTPWSPQFASMFARLISKPDASKEWLCDETDAVSKGYKRAYAR